MIFCRLQITNLELFLSSFVNSTNVYSSFKTLKLVNEIDTAIVGTALLQKFFPMDLVEKYVYDSRLNKMVPPCALSIKHPYIALSHTRRGETTVFGLL